MSGDEERFYIRNDLEDYASTPATSFDSRRPQRQALVDALLPDDAHVRVYNPGGYQGAMGFVIYLDDYVWLIKEYYGSCSICDGLLASDDKLEYGRSILRNAYCCESEHDAIRFLNKKLSRNESGWSRIARQMQEIIEGSR